MTSRPLSLHLTGGLLAKDDSPGTDSTRTFQLSSPLKGAIEGFHPSHSIKGLHSPRSATDPRPTCTNNQEAFALKTRALA
ncbi:uncharacterized protein G2W53_007912 [Senna tora]|uniref:Uncharacterized protein n=1 Tax=Senna tora TaxID=362788 RepID=A0A835CGB0_9FABA|nr:uncharacterized protein G2W53_007912 [Senna tora]